MVSDADLYARWMQADRAAGDELVIRHQTALLRSIYAIAGEQTTAARDVAQTTWLIAQRSGSFTGRGSFRGWLRSIARSQMKPERRPVSLTPATRTTASRLVLRKQVVAAINDLSDDDQREVATLVWVGGLSARDISAQTGTKLETVRSRIRLARAKLRAKLRTAS